MDKLSLEDLDVHGLRVLVRVDFNVPLHDGEVGDDTRIRAALPTIRAITSSGGKAILMSHLGRPKGEPDAALTLAPVAERLEELLDEPVRFVSMTIGPAVERAVAELPAGGVLLLENTRFQPGEKKNDPEFARRLAMLGNLYVNDAFGAAHRAHASTEGVTRHAGRSAMGLLMKNELEHLSRLIEAPEHPYVAVLGGAKVSDKIGVIENLLGRVDALLIGGAMSYTFLRALGKDVGDSRVEEDKIDVAADLLDRAGGKINLPGDHVAAEAFDNDAPHRTVEQVIPAGLMGLDIGPNTVEAYRSSILSARTVVWNGPMGVFEMSSYASGTYAVAEAMAEATDAGAFTVVGGGDSVAAITEAGYEDRVAHVSTGGGAMLEFLEGRTLPGVAALSDRDAS